MGTSGIVRAVQAAGSQANLAQHIGVTPAAVNIWLKRGWVPIGRAREIEQATGVPRARLIKPQILELLNTKMI